MVGWLVGSLQTELGENRIAENDAEHLSNVLFDKTMVVGVHLHFGDHCRVVVVSVGSELKAVLLDLIGWLVSKGFHQSRSLLFCPLRGVEFIRNGFPQII